MNQVTTVSDQMIELENTQKMCQTLLKTPHYAKMGGEGVFAIVSKAKSLQMDPIYALNGGLYYLQGKVGMPAEAMSALIRERGHSITKDPKSNNEICILHGRRGDNGDTWTSSFSMEDAKRAGLMKNMYEKYPATMLYNRAMSFLARQLFSDIIKGAGYTYEELKEIAENNSKRVEPIVLQQEKTKNVITSDQALELNHIFMECPTEYKSQVLTHLKKISSLIEDVEDIPCDLYERIKNAAIKKRDAHKNSSQIEIAEVVNQ